LEIMSVPRFNPSACCLQQAQGLSWGILLRQWFFEKLRSRRVNIV
jgi:hypothetical protein